MADDAYESEIERRAEELGLPTDPEAYQDGGMAGLTTAPTLSEAETLVALLRSEDIPAWVKAPLATLNILSGPAIFEVFVPAGRLSDAQKLLDEMHPLPTAPVRSAVEEEEFDAEAEGAATPERGEFNESRATEPKGEQYLVRSAQRRHRIAAGVATVFMVPAWVCFVWEFGVQVFYTSPGRRDTVWDIKVLAIALGWAIWSFLTGLVLYYLIRPQRPEDRARS
jgi:hypothetical protein